MALNLGLRQPTPSLSKDKWAMDEEQRLAAQQERMKTYNMNDIQSGSNAADASSAQAMQTNIGAAGQAANMVGQTIDPKGVGMGSALTGAATGAAVGSMVTPVIGTAVGAAVGLGLGLLQGAQKRKQIRKDNEAVGMGLLAKGYENAQSTLQQGANNSQTSFASTRGLKL